MSIAFLTLAVMALVTPFTMKSTRSMMKMQLVAPELKKIQQKYKGDRAALREAQMEFYKEKGVNPMGACLPLLIQGPIFLVLYRVVLGLTRRATQIGNQLGHTSSQWFLHLWQAGDNPADAAAGTVATGTSASGEDAVFTVTPITETDLRFDPDFLDPATNLYKNLTGETEMVSWGVDLSMSASSALGKSTDLVQGVVNVFPYLLMMLAVLVTGIYQQKQIRSRQTSRTVNPTQETVMKFLPFFLPVLSWTMPAAVVVYFIISAVCRIGQQYYIGRSMYSGEESLGGQIAKQNKIAEQNKSEDARKKPVNTSYKSEKSDTSSKAKRVSAPVRKSKNVNGVKRIDAAPYRSSNRRGHSSVERSASGVSGKAPSRSNRERPLSGRVTPSRQRLNRAPSRTTSKDLSVTSKHSRATSNRSKNKKKRR